MLFIITVEKIEWYRLGEKIRSSGYRQSSSISSTLQKKPWCIYIVAKYCLELDSSCIVTFLFWQIFFVLYLDRVRGNEDGRIFGHIPIYEEKFSFNKITLLQKLERMQLYYSENGRIKLLFL